MHDGIIRSVMNFVSDSIIIMDNKGILSFINPAAGNLFGYAGEGIIGEHVSLLIPELFGDSSINSKASISEVGKKSVGKRKNGSLFPLTITVVESSEGGDSSFIGIVREITKHVISEVWQNKILNDTIFEIYIFSSFPSQFLYMNQTAIRQLGYSMEEMAKVSPIGLWPKFSEEDFQFMLDSILSGEKEFVRFDTNHKRKTGSYYPVDVRIQLISEKGEAPVFIAVAQDSSPRKEAEAIQRKAERALLYSNVMID